MQKTIVGDTPFKAAKDQFAVAATESGYQVAYSVDKENWTLDDQAIVPAGETLIYLGSMQYAWYKLSGNTEEVMAIL